MSHAKLIMTDSGGIQEEACILEIPCITLRDNTERPESVQVGTNLLAGTDPHQILKYVKKVINVNKKWVNPFGDGFSSWRIIRILCEKLRLKMVKENKITDLDEISHKFKIRYS